jgi:hypothetical protein
MIADTKTSRGICAIHSSKKPQSLLYGRQVNYTCIQQNANNNIIALNNTYVHKQEYQLLKERKRIPRFLWEITKEKTTKASAP